MAFKKKQRMVVDKKILIKQMIFSNLEQAKLKLIIISNKKTLPLLGEKDKTFLKRLVESAIVGSFAPVFAIGLRHKDFLIETSGAGVLVAEIALSVVPPFRVDKMLRFDVSDDDRSDTRVGVLQVNFAAIEQLEHHGCDILGHIAHLNNFCHTFPPCAFARSNADTYY